MAKSRDIELQVGRRANDGTVKLSAYPPELLQLSVSYRGERSASVLLTRQQIQQLRQALTEFENEMPPPSETTETWDNQERRQEEQVLITDGY
jgi:hypothetical protein